jgi:hypothetical protein
MSTFLGFIERNPDVRDPDLCCWDGHMAHSRYTTTRKKLATNRKNAQRSTGPRTPDGKLATRLNALAHGILAKEVIGSGAILGESPDDFESLLSGLIEVYKPSGRAEELAVEEIAVTYIRRARAMRAERAEIERAQREQDERETIDSLRLCGLALRSTKSFSAKADILRSEYGIDYLTELCDRSLQQLQSDQVDQASLGEIDRVLNTHFVDDLIAPHLDLHALEQQLSEFKLELGREAAALEERKRLRMLSRSLPPTSVLERTIRYESLLDRQVMRAIQWLEMLQQSRRSLEIEKG